MVATIVPDTDRDETVIVFDVLVMIIPMNAAATFTCRVKELIEAVMPDAFCATNETFCELEEVKVSETFCVVNYFKTC